MTGTAYAELIRQQADGDADAAGALSMFHLGYIEERDLFEETPAEFWPLVEAVAEGAESAREQTLSPADADRYASAYEDLEAQLQAAGACESNEEP